MTPTESGAMHLVINASDLGRRRGGNETYLLGLLGGLAFLQSRARVSLIVAGDGSDLVEAYTRLRRFEVVDVGPYHRVPFLLWQQTAILRRLRPDWLISTFFLPPVIPCQAALLIHDLSFRAHPEYYPPAIAAYMRLLTGLAIRRADIVVALSQFTREELARYYPSCTDKVAVVYPGVRPEFVPDGDPAVDDAVLAGLHVQRPYLLAVGNIHPRKNLARLLAAWERLRDGGAPVPVMAWVGLDRWASGDLLSRARAAGVKLLGFVDAAHLPALYRRAEALAYPSLYEGFGLPPLEAMACGTPVLAANTTSLPEAVGNAAVTADPTDVSALADGLARVLFDGSLRQELIAKGFVQAAQFRWEQAAGRLLDVAATAAGDASVP
jgi:glycosyltransferase involved in cell wall biosynthesis